MIKDHIYCRIHVGLCAALIGLLCIHCIHVCVVSMCDINVFVYHVFDSNPFGNAVLKFIYLFIDCTFSTALFHHHLHHHIAIICRHFASPAIAISVLAAVATAIAVLLHFWCSFFSLPFVRSTFTFNFIISNCTAR